MELIYYTIFVGLGLFLTVFCGCYALETYKAMNNGEEVIHYFVAYVSLSVLAFLTSVSMVAIIIMML